MRLPKFKKLLKQRQKILTLVLISFSLLLIFLGISQIFHHKSVAVHQQAGAAHAPTPAPSATKLKKDEIDSYKVAPNSPRFLYIPAIDIPKTRIMHLGVGKDGQIAVPASIFDTGWYTGSVLPGETGAMFIYGHVSNWTANGIFYNLKQLKPSDRVVVERGDGKQFTYAVVRTKIYQADSVDMNELLSPTVPHSAALNLMTCTGKVKKGTSEFTERLVVFTELES